MKHPPMLLRSSCLACSAAIRWVWVGWLYALLLCVAGQAQAVPRALLVGVSELVNQPAILWLQAPRNDVTLMRDTLLRQGFQPQDVTTLADGVAGAAQPDAAGVHEALTRLLNSSRSGDFVLLYFSGHGTRFRDPLKQYQEPDGLAESFLARDARGVSGVEAGLAGGIRDVDFEAWVKAFLARNVFVWAVFDTCSATSMTRGGAASPEDPEALQDEVRFRGVRAGQLTRGAPAPQTLSAPPLRESPPRARYVAFFASESHQVTPELKLPRKSRDARAHGLLTWAIAESLGRKPATWRELYAGVLSLYPPVIDELEKRFPTRELPSPVAEGALDAAVFSNAPAPASTRPVWPAQRAGASLVVRAGLLDGIETGQAVRVVSVLPDGATRLADARVGVAEMDSARLDVPASLATASGAAVWSVTPRSDPVEATLRVRADRLPDGLALEYPASIRLVPEGGSADVRLVESGAGGSGRLEVLATALYAGDTAPAAESWPDTDSLRRRLQNLAQVKWLTRLEALAADGAMDGFSAVLELAQPGGHSRSEPMAGRMQLKLPAADGTSSLVVRNTSGQSVDLVIVAVDARGTVHTLYPEDSSATNRFERGTRQNPATKKLALPAWGTGWLAVVASPAQAQSLPRLYGLQARDDGADVRVRGQLTPEKSRPVFASVARWGYRAAPDK